MMKKFLLLLLLLLLASCSFYTFPEQAPSFYDLGIDQSQFNSLGKITIYIETTIETVDFNNCFVMPWDMMIYKRGSEREKCGLFLWMAKEAGLISDGCIIRGGNNYANRHYYATDEFRNPIYNFADWMAIKTYSEEGLYTYLYRAGQDLCLKITKKESFIW